MAGPLKIIAEAICGFIAAVVIVGFLYSAWWLVTHFLAGMAVVIGTLAHLPAIDWVFVGLSGACMASTRVVPWVWKQMHQPLPPDAHPLQRRVSRKELELIAQALTLDAQPMQQPPPPTGTIPPPARRTRVLQLTHCVRCGSPMIAAACDMCGWRL